jgi:hypothetical protein
MTFKYYPGYLNAQKYLRDLIVIPSEDNNRGFKETVRELIHFRDILQVYYEDRHKIFGLKHEDLENDSDSDEEVDVRFAKLRSRVSADQHAFIQQFIETMLHLETHLVSNFSDHHGEEHENVLKSRILNEFEEPNRKIQDVMENLGLDEILVNFMLFFGEEGFKTILTKNLRLQYRRKQEAEASSDKQRKPHGK